MNAAPPHPEEERRLSALRELRLLDTPAESLFDDITELAAGISGRPIALVSLVDRDRQWFKSKVGLDAPETPRELAFCAHAIVQDEPIFEVPDAHVDARFDDNPLVTGPPNVTAYAGATLHSPNGMPVGTLCVIDHRRSALDEEQRAGLLRLARLTEALFAQRALLDELAATTRKALELERMLRSYTSQNVWATLDGMDSGSVPKLVSGETENAFVFADLSGFTRLSGRLPPHEVAELLDARLGPASELVYAHGGDVEKFIGDAIFAVFPDSASALAFAFELQQSALEIPPVYGEPLQFTVGVHCGGAVRVHLGSERRRDNTLIGEAVNVAARLQSACLPGGILVSEEALLASGDPRRGARSELELRGVAEPVVAHFFG